MHLKAIEAQNQEWTLTGPGGSTTPSLVGGQAPEPVNAHTSLMEVKAAGGMLWQHKVVKSPIAGFLKHTIETAHSNALWGNEWHTMGHLLALVGNCQRMDSRVPMQDENGSHDKQKDSCMFEQFHSQH